MEPLRRHEGSLAIYPEDHVDTDRIIPARFLSRVERSGYGELLFSDVRGDEFPLDQTEAQGASILVVGTNFGCGSSREHAVWAIQQAGFRAVIARAEADSPGYSDIFRQNAGNCGLLLVEIPSEEHAALVALGQGASVTVDLEAQVVELSGKQVPFQIAETTRDQILKGLDLIGTTLEFNDKISGYEEKSDSFSPSASRG